MFSQRANDGAAGIGPPANLREEIQRPSGGPITDRTKEHLGTLDRKIILVRRMLINAAKDLEKGIEPPALDPASQRVRAAAVLLDRKIKAPEWAKQALVDGLKQPVFTL